MFWTKILAWTIALAKGLSEAWSGSSGSSGSAYRHTEIGKSKRSSLQADDDDDVDRDFEMTPMGEHSIMVACRKTRSAFFTVQGCKHGCSS